MRPVLFVIPAPSGSVPLAALLLALALVACVIAVLGVRSGARELVGVGTVGAVASLAGAVFLPGARFQTAGFPVFGYGFALCVAFLSAMALARTLARRDGLAAVERILAIGAAAGLLGARLLYVLTNARAFDSAAAVFALRRGGFSLYGGLLAGTLAAWLYARRDGVRFPVIADVAAPAAALGLAIGRIGCYLFGCDFGRPLGVWAPSWLRRLGTFPRWSSESFPLGTGSPAWMHHVLHRGVPFDHDASLPVHPTQLYEALGAAFILSLGLSLRRRRMQAGSVALWTLFSYAGLRFVLELYRDDPERGIWGPSIPAAWTLAGAALIVAAALIAGPLRRIAILRYRWAAAGAVVSLAPLSYLLARAARVPEFAHWATTAPQWFALFSAGATAVAWRRMAATR